MKLLIKNRKLFPKCVRGFKELKGICVGVCIDDACPNYLKEHNQAAHAHSHPNDPYYGYICLKYKYRLKEKYTLLHEVAHLIVSQKNKVPTHGKEWRKVVKEIGGTYKSYRSHKKGWVYKDFTYSDPVRHV